MGPLTWGGEFLSRPALALRYDGGLYVPRSGRRWKSDSRGPRTGPGPAVGGLAALLHSDWDGMAGWNLDPWDLAILGVGAYVAVISLVRLMARRRNQILDEVREQVRQAAARRASVDADADAEEA